MPSVHFNLTLKEIKMYTLKTASLLLFVVFLAGCANKVQPLYSWGNYEREVYDYFKTGSVEKQIIELEKHIEKSKATGAALPPGYQAHLGLLYSKVGRDDKLAEQLLIEKANFPESSGFFDGLIKKFTK